MFSRKKRSQDKRVFKIRKVFKIEIRNHIFETSESVCETAQMRINFDFLLYFKKEIITRKNFKRE